MTRVLLLEDNCALADSVIRAIQSHGHTVDWAATVAEAEEIYEPDRYGVLLCDYDLPDGTGLDFLSGVRGSDKAVTILWSGLHRDREVEAAEIHVDHVLLKSNISAVLDLIGAE